MIEVYGNLWDYEADAVVITTNGTVKRNGEAVMGRGCAKEAAEKWPRLPMMLGNRIRSYGNIVQHFEFEECPHLITFPVKDTWPEVANIRLITMSAEDLEIETDMWSFDKVVMPRPGCGNGHLRWEDVKPILEPLLDDRFHVITFAP